jgi:hypothetical protein
VAASCCFMLRALLLINAVYAVVFVFVRFLRILLSSFVAIYFIDSL